MSSLKAIITFPAGFAKEALNEIDSILAHLWLKKNKKPLANIEKNSILITNIHIDSIFEIIFRCPGITDIKLVISQSHVKNKSNLKTLCDSIPWSDFVDENFPIKIKVNSVASSLFHEGAIKEVVLSSKLSALIERSKLPPTSGATDSHLCNHLFFGLYKNNLTICVSLAGQEIYKRNYKKVMSASAPLREDIAHFCLKKCLQNKKVSTLYVPFGGTGTFIFEYLILLLKLPNNFFGRKFIFESTSIFKEKTIQFIKKKSIHELEQSKIDLNKIIYSDNAANVQEKFNENLYYFMDKVKDKVLLPSFLVDSRIENFLKLDVSSLKSAVEGEVVFMPLNPPYGFRQQSKVDSVQFYSKIIQKIQELGGQLALNNVNLHGFILCPSEETWSVAMNKIHSKSKETFHFTQGGIHIRVVLFEF